MKGFGRGNAEEKLGEKLLLGLGALQARMVQNNAYRHLWEAEFQVFSQFGEDGIIQYLLSRIDVPTYLESFVEIGVEDYREANTRFLLMKDNWRGVIVDAGSDHVDFVKSHDLGWRHDITAVSTFVTRENVNSVISSAGLSGEIGLLSIDIDGNDIWLLEALEAVSPLVLTIEYNSLFGPEGSVAVPYSESFSRFQAHHSGVYWGSSLSAIAEIARLKGYRLVGSNKAGNNAFFLRKDVDGGIPTVDVMDAWRPARFREARDRAGRLTYEADRLTLLSALRDLPLVVVPEGRISTVAEILTLD